MTPFEDDFARYCPFHDDNSPKCSHPDSEIANCAEKTCARAHLDPNHRFAVYDEDEMRHCRGSVEDGTYEEYMAIEEGDLPLFSADDKQGLLDKSKGMMTAYLDIYILLDRKNMSETEYMAHY